MSFFCCLENLFIIFSFHIKNVFGELLNVPSPEQGASRRILSNLNLSFDMAEQRAIASFLETIVLVTPHFSKLETRIFIRSIFRSLAMIVPEFSIRAAI